MKQVPNIFPIPRPFLSQNFDQTKHHLYIGDNLEVLQRLLPAYAGTVGVIVADPPYGRGRGDTGYQDNLADPNAWMNFLRPRLSISRELLASDGVILVHIDDRKVHWLRVLLDDIFGAENYVNTIVWCYGAISRFKPHHLRNSHEYILAYANNLGKVNLNPVQDVKTKYRNVASTVRRLSGKFQFSFEEGLSALGIYRDRTTGELFEWYSRRSERKDFFNSPIDDVWHIGPVNRMSKEYIPGFLGQKPVALVRRLLQVFGKEDSLVLDCFAGTGTTGEAVLQLNREDGGRRTFILVQSPEACREPVLLEQGYRYISDITLGRMQRVYERYQQSGGDVSFQVMEL